ncbi:MAG: hypothetical protein GX418_13785 [Clostridiales bacterium]|nr:hypothetical protein [Clostridiales bacterium]
MTATSVTQAVTTEANAAAFRAAQAGMTATSVTQAVTTEANAAAFRAAQAGTTTAGATETNATQAVTTEANAAAFRAAQAGTTAAATAEAAADLVSGSATGGSPSMRMNVLRDGRSVSPRGWTPLTRKPVRGAPSVRKGLFCLLGQAETERR